MNNTQDRTKYPNDLEYIETPSGTLPYDYPTKQGTWNIPITMQTLSNSYFLEIEYTYVAKFCVHECIGFISAEKYYFDSLKQALEFIKKKGGIK